MIKLRDYQKSLKNNILDKLAQGSMSVLAVLPTGAGKTVIMADIIDHIKTPACLVAHRQELIGQISTALARTGTRHRIIAPPGIIRLIVQRHMTALGRSYVDQRSHIAVAGIDTLIRAPDDSWRRQVRLVEIDEAHHCLPGNKWGKVREIFPHAALIGWTATPCRADKKPLGQMFDAMVIGPGMRTLIERGHLADYRIYGPPPSVDVGGVPLGADGDYNQPRLRAKVTASRIFGDVVKHYKTIAPGALGFTFCVSIEAAARQTREFIAAGVPAACLHGGDTDSIRQEILRKFERRELLQICSVDLFGEGVDIPELECVSMARPTASYALFVQQFGRPLRPASGKPYGIIIDHTGNVRRMAEKYGLPDSVMTWSLTEPPKRASRIAGDGVRFCLQCFRPMEAYKKRCPHCGYIAPAASRSDPEAVAGDLTEYSPELLASLRKRAAHMGTPYVISPAANARDRAVHRRHCERLDAQSALQEALAWYGGWAASAGLDMPDSYRLFYRVFGVDALTAQTLSAAEMTDLTEQIHGELHTHISAGG